MPAKGLGRIYAQDLNDLKYPLRAARPGLAPLAELPQKIQYRRGPISDQGYEGTCVEHSLMAKLRGAPIVVGISRAPKQHSIYDAAVLIDEFHMGPDPVHTRGTSVRAGCKVLQDMGFISAYHWAFTVDEATQWMLSGQGGLVLGIDWLERMSEPTDEGIIRAQGHVQGGHAIYAFGVDMVGGFIELQNSWGESWGGWTVGHRPAYRGCARLPLDDLGRLMAGNGEAVAILEVPFRRTRTHEPTSSS